MRASLVVLVASALVFASCGGGADDPEMPPQDPTLVARGAELYAANCAECHGDDLRGTDRGPSHLSEVYEPGHHGDGAFLVAIRAGVPQHHWDFGSMPAIDGLTDEDIESIVAFVRDRQNDAGFEPYPP